VRLAGPATAPDRARARGATVDSESAREHARPKRRWTAGATSKVLVGGNWQCLTSSLALAAAALNTT
jgi:hypothetical protein